MLKVTRGIRLLHIGDGTKLKVIPENIGYLHHLRYLSFHSDRIVDSLPKSLSSLYHLQFLTIGEASCSNGYFPRDMNKLSNLRYFGGCWMLNFPGIGKLKYLQNLNGFCIKNENGYRIEELEHMNELRILEIYKLGNVSNAKMACNAELCDKRKLTFLSLYWNYDEGHIVSGDLEARVLDNLQPHNYLKTFHMKYYMGARSAIWMNNAHFINNLEEILLSECSEWEILPPFGQLPFLKNLMLWNMPKVKRLENKFHGNDMCCVFPSLEKLNLTNMKELVDWFDASVVDGLFPCLTTLFLKNCPNLQELPYLPPKLKSLEIDNIDWKTFNCCNISKSIPLKKLQG